MKKIISLMLCIAMLLSLTACGGNPEETTVPTTVPPTTEPGPDPLEVYAAAVEQVNSMDSMLVGYTTEQVMALGTDTFTETQVYSVSMKDIGTENFLACASNEISWGEDYYAYTNDVYSAGTYYGAVDGFAYTTPMTAEEYLDQYAPRCCWTRPYTPMWR